MQEYGTPRLALNCVGGKSATNLLRCLRLVFILDILLQCCYVPTEIPMIISCSDDGTLVTYGGMSQKPLTIPTVSNISTAQHLCLMCNTLG